jgi:hypothetical protein
MAPFKQCGPGISRRIVLAVLVGFSAVSTLAGMWFLTRFDQTAGPVSAAPEKWPSSSAINRLNGRPEILVFAHPFCSCTDATLDELAQLSMRRKKDAAVPAITVLFYRPVKSAWVASNLWKKAQSLEGARVVWDYGGLEATRFGARTSGLTLLYSPEGKLLFRGGITGSRGHRGDNFGLDNLTESLASNRPTHLASRVFGCALGNPDAEVAGKL